MFLPDGDAAWGPEFESAAERAAFAAWHAQGDQRTLRQTDEDGDLDNQVAWWRNGGHLLAIEPEVM